MAVVINKEPVSKVGVIGLGQMGSGIARNLHQQGLLAAVWDIDPSALAPLAEERLVPVVRSPREVAEFSDVVVFVVPSSNEVRDCLNGSDGVLSTDKAGQVILDLTTSDPRVTKSTVGHVQSHGRAYLDAGMSGGAQAAANAQLSLMVGGSLEVYERCMPVFEAIADVQRVRRVGAEGAGHTMKLIHNMICHSIFLITAEGCRLAEHSGIDLATAIDVINDGNARSFVSELRFPRHILSGKWDGRSRVANLEKDLRLGVDFAREVGVPALFAAPTAAFLSHALEEGMAEQDFTLLYREFDRLTGFAQSQLD
ncbi:MAG: NAD(P)-dependent oxidoreductase [Hyphomicrobiaceae bacterium]